MKNWEYEGFKELNEYLKQNGISVSIVCVGGYVLQYNGIRETKDVDAFFCETKELKNAIKEIGKRLKINNNEELWLNNSVQNLNKQPNNIIARREHWLNIICPGS